jgi:arginyl-tRNA synthetase
VDFACNFASPADLQPLRELARQARREDRLGGGGDVVGNPVEAGGPVVGVELQPGGAGVAVARLPDAAGVEQPLAALQRQQGPVAGLGAGRVAGSGAVPAGEEEGDVGVADQPDPLRLGVHPRLRLVGRQHVLPDRIAGGGVEEADALALAGRLQSPQEIQARRAGVLARPLDRRRRGLREGGDVEPAQRRQVVVADQADVAAALDQVGAGVRLGAVADHVAEAPDLLDRGQGHLLEHCLESGLVGVDIAEDGCAQAASVPWASPGPYDWRVSATDSIAELRSAVDQAARALRDGEPTEPAPSLDRPPKPELGDYSSNAAMLLAAPLGDNPRSVAARLQAELERGLGEAGALDRVEVAGPGFVNLFLSDAWYRQALARLVAAGERLGPEPTPSPERILVEFLSANPTGPLHVGGGRHAAYGDSVVRLLRTVGHEVESEYYVNDAGSQIARFADSIAARMSGGEPPEDGYEGAYVAELAERIAAEGLDPADGAALGARGVELMLAQVRATLERFGVAPYDTWFHERDLYERGEVESALADLERRGHTYRHEEALWLRTTDFGDDKDRVLIRANGEPTYLAADVAYHWDKLQRRFGRLVDVLGADHHGYVGRIRAAIEALGADPDAFEALIMSLVHIVEGGERAQMSKRSGDFVSLDDLLDDIGVDAARWFMLWRSHETTVDLDLQLARSQSSENPVYYVQYAHARIASILRKAGPAAAAAEGPLDARAVSASVEPSERALIKRLLEFPEEIRESAARRAPHRICAYSTAVAADFHAFYRDCQVVGAEGEGVERSRLALCLVAKRTIASALDLLGISAPERM